MAKNLWVKRGVIGSTEEKVEEATTNNDLNFSISCLPDGSTVTINEQVRNSVTVKYGDEVRFSATKTNYYPDSNRLNIFQDTQLNLSLSPILYTFDIEATPYDSTVIINGEETSTLTAIQGTEITWSVSKPNYVTQNGTYTLLDNLTEYVDLSIQQYTFTINPTPNDATVTLTALGYTQSGNSITVPYGTTVSYNVSKFGYTAQSGTYNITNDYAMAITLESEDPYIPGTVLASLANNQTYTATLPAGKYRVRITGGGGGGVWRQNQYYTTYYYTGGGGANFEGIIYNPTSQTITLYACAAKGTSYLDLGGVRMITCANGGDGWYTYYPKTVTVWQHGGGAGGVLTLNSSLQVVSTETSGNGNNGIDETTDTNNAWGGLSGSTQNWGRGEWCISPYFQYGGAILEYISQ